jgi:hypothetical protein
MAMSEAISAFCRTFGLNDVPSGSSPQSRLRALGGHVRSRLRGAPTKRRSPWSRPKGLMRLPRVQARCWLPSLRWRSFRLCRRLRPSHILPRVETMPRVLLLPLPTLEPMGNNYFKCVYVSCDC